MEVALGRPRCAWFAIFGCSCVRFRRALSEQLCFQLALQPQLEFCAQGGSFHREVTSQVVLPVVQAAKCLSHLFRSHSYSGNAEGGFSLEKVLSDESPR